MTGRPCLSYLTFLTVGTHEASISLFRDLILGSDFTESVHMKLLGTNFEKE
jgi:hypothetical protein